MGRIISLDLGEISLGVAISDEMKIIATPVENFFFERNNLKQAKEILLNVINEYKNVELVLLGYPLRTDGEKSDITYLVEEFKELIEDIGVEVRYIDETNSTQDGIKMLSETIKDKEKIKSLKDVAAAYVILKNYLDLLK